MSSKISKAKTTKTPKTAATVINTRSTIRVLKPEHQREIVSGCVKAYLQNAIDQIVGTGVTIWDVTYGVTYPDIIIAAAGIAEEYDALMEEADEECMCDDCAAEQQQNSQEVN